AVEYSYKHHNLTGASDALRNTSHYHYLNHLLVKETNRNNLSFYFEYDGSDHTAYCLRTWGDGGIYDHKLHYDLERNITVVENSLGSKTIYAHNGSVVHEASTEDGSTTITKRNLHNDIVERIDAEGNKTLYDYNGSGYLTSITNPNGSKKTFIYDEENNLIQYENEVNARWTMEYDARNRLIQTTDPLGVNTRYTYANNLLHSISTADETEQVLLYDEHHNIRAIIKNEIPLSQYRYD